MDFMTDCDWPCSREFPLSHHHPRPKLTLTKLHYRGSTTPIIMVVTKWFEVFGAKTKDPHLTTFPGGKKKLKKAGPPRRKTPITTRV